MFIPSHRAPRDLNPLPDRKADCLIGNDDVPSLRKGGDDTRDDGEGLCIDDAGRRPQVRCDVRFGLHMHILRAVKPGGAAGADAVRSESLDGLLFQAFVSDEIVEVVACKIGDGAAVGEFASRSRRPADSVGGQL